MKTNNQVINLLSFSITNRGTKQVSGTKSLKHGFQLALFGTLNPEKFMMAFLLSVGGVPRGVTHNSDEIVGCYCINMHELKGSGCIDPEATTLLPNR
ncbi:hypothetical protein [Glutamicibacter sp. BW77]|uniref:hypothetical protein n=1 Tax=Glutamicibacter sp. BW77 TaxID=2024402 RepID=UPI0011426713|nr:hypothetical protein [Glutamicibacter sp. BW77]